MGDKGPKTKRGKERKTWTGDGRRRTPGEELAKSLDDTDKTLKKIAMGEVNRAMEGAASGKKKKQAKKRK